MKRNLELNITMKCNVGCVNCNRMCDIYRDRTEHMTVDQIKRFVEDVKKIGGIHRLKVIGGEPLMHPDFVNIYNVLLEAVKDRYITYMRIETNGTLPCPNVEKSEFVKLAGRRLRKRCYLPVLWSPSDMGFQTKGPCDQIRRCGISMDKFGYLPCSPGIMITRLFGFNHLYKKEITMKPWGLEELCPHCVFSMDDDWISKHWYPIVNPPLEASTPTKTYQEGIRNFNTEEFYKV